MRIVDDTLTPDCPQAPGLCGDPPIVDMGAYEFGSVPCDPTDISSDPPNCAIDAGITGADHTRPRWNHIDIMFPCSMELPTDLEFKVSTEPAGVTPVILNVIQKNHFTVTLELNQPIPPGRWTCFTHSSGPQVCLGFLPSDANGNRTAGISDIIDIMENLNGIYNPPMALWQCDVNRSGECNAADILVTIDLLNGAVEFDPWNDQSLPVCPSKGP